MDILFWVGCAILLLSVVLELQPRKIKRGLQHQRTDRYTGYLILIACAFLAGVGIMSKITGFLSLPQWTEIAGIMLLVFGIITRRVAMRALGADFNYTIAPVACVKTTGIYGCIRHPGYLGALIYALGIALLFSSLPSLLSWLVVLGTILRRIRLEEKFLEQTMGTEYVRYKRNTSALLPYVY